MPQHGISSYQTASADVVDSTRMRLEEGDVEIQNWRKEKRNVADQSRNLSARDQMPVGNAISRARLRASRAVDHVYVA